ncbi:putative phage infection (PIP) family protein YhgE [Paenibacillus sp. DS2015]|uniref:YhgE/Pip domain-containing protein n=1 Tax=Paenibacillus sp. DS2015 TaxID=3373917 RepID=UPI003D1BE769
MKGNRYIGIAFILVLAIQLVFLSTQIPGVYSSPENLPIGIVVADQGALGQTLVDTIMEKSTTDHTGREPMIKWVPIESEQEMNTQMADKELYGAIVIPANFSEQYATLQTATPISAEMLLYVNQGKNTAVASVVSQTLNTLATQVNKVMSQQLFTAFEQQNLPLTVEQARIFSTPIVASTTTLFETGELSNAPLSFFQPIWLATYSAILIWMLGKKRIFSTVVDQLKFRGYQVLISIALGIFTGFTLTALSSWMLGYEFDSFMTVALFLTISSVSFGLLILGLASWIGFGALPILILLMFFGAPLLQLAPEMMPSFYADWVYPWLPMRFMFDGIKDILFFEGSVWNNSTPILVAIAVLGMFLTFAKGTAKAAEKDQEKSA